MGSDFSSGLDSVFSSALGLATTVSTVFGSLATGLEDSDFASELPDGFSSVFSAFVSSDFASVDSDFASSGLTSGVEGSNVASKDSVTTVFSTSAADSFD